MSGVDHVELHCSEDPIFPFTCFGRQNVLLAFIVGATLQSRRILPTPIIEVRLIARNGIQWVAILP